MLIWAIVHGIWVMNLIQNYAIESWNIDSHKKRIYMN